MLTSLKKEFLAASLLLVEWPFLLCVSFFYHSKRKFPTTLKENSYILPFNPREEVKMSYCSKASCFPPRRHATILRSPKLTTNLNVCSVNSWSSVFQIPPNQPSWQATVDLFHSPFPWQLSPRDRGGFTRRQSAAVESLFTAWLKCWYSLACVTASLCSSMSISASLRKYIISVSMVIPVIRLLVKPDSCVAVILSFFLAIELRGRTPLPLMKSWPGFFGVYVFPG